MILIDIPRITYSYLTPHCIQTRVMQKEEESLRTVVEFVMHTHLHRNRSADSTKAYLCTALPENETLNEFGMNIPKKKHNYILDIIKEFLRKIRNFIALNINVELNKAVKINIYIILIFILYVLY